MLFKEATQIDTGGKWKAVEDHKLLMGEGGGEGGGESLGYILTMSSFSIHIQKGFSCCNVISFSLFLWGKEGRKCFI